MNPDFSTEHKWLLRQVLTVGSIVGAAAIGSFIYRVAVHAGAAVAAALR